VIPVGILKYEFHRELAMQTFKFAKDIAKFTDLRVIAIVGGDPIEAQFEALASRPDVIIATPGRLMHHLREISTFKLKHVEYLVFDEADRLFEMGVRLEYYVKSVVPKNFELKSPLRRTILRTQFFYRHLY
jgi:superfamily II DNA/RNA helicase